VRQLPCFTLWKNPQALSDGCVTGLEPSTNHPNRRSFEKLRKRIVALAPGATHAVDLELEFHPDAAAVARAQADVARIAAGRATELRTQIDPRWGPL
jgi:hypothetical protein